MNMSCEAYEERKYLCRILTGNLRGKDHLECLSVDGRNIKIYLQEIGWNYVN
jgi:hypothetical protein